MTSCCFLAIFEINMQQNNKGSNIGSIIIFIIVVALGVLWFNNTHPSAHYNGLEDYRDTWFTGTSVVSMLYCGKSPSIYCDPSGNWFIGSATWNGKERAADADTEWIHDFTLRFPNGGWVETEATCDKAATGYYSYKRFCKATAYDEYGNMMVFLVVPYD